MGNSSSKEKEPYVPLAAISVPIGKNVFYTQHTTELTLRVQEKKYRRRGNEYEVKDISTTQTIFRIKKLIETKSLKIIQDPQGETLYEIEQKGLFTRSYTGKDGKTRTKHFKVKNHGRKGGITFQNSIGNGEKISLDLKGDLYDRNVEFVLKTGEPVARLRRELKEGSKFHFTKKTYILTVAPGVDASLILAICICLDVATRPNNSSTNAASFSGGAAAAGGGGGAAGGGC